MSKSLSVATVIEKNKLASNTPFILLLDIDVIDPVSGAVVETLHVAKNSEPVLWNTFTYEKGSFDIQLEEESGTLKTVQLAIKDYSLAVQKKMQAYGGGIGFGVTITVINAARLSEAAEVQEFFEVVGAESANYVCTFTLGAENTVTKTFPRRRQARDYCQWRYKGEECGYSGSNPSCDLSLKGPNGCEVHGNSIRFGAYPGINTRDVRYG